MALLGGMDMETLMAFADSDPDVIFERLQEPYDDLEQRVVVSSMVQGAVAKGFLKAIEEESCMHLASKDMEIASLRDLLKEKDACISDLQTILGIAEDEASVVGNADRTRSKHLWDFLQESQKKWRESEADVAEKEKELERLASSMAFITLLLDKESKRAAMLEKQLNDCKEQDAIKSKQISSFQQDIDKLKLDNSSLKRQARLKNLQFEESMEHTQTELQQQSVLSESLLQEKRVLEKTIEDRNRAFSNMERDYGSLESHMHVLDDELKHLMKVESKLRETIEGENMMHKGEEDLLMAYITEQMKAVHAEVKTYIDLTCFQQDSGQQQVLPCTTGGPNTTEMANDMTELTWIADAEALIAGIVIEGWYKDMAEVLQKLSFELAWKDEEIFFRDGQLGSLKQAVEELENDYATLMSICLTLIRDQTDNNSREESPESSVHELGRRKLMELSEFLSSKDAFGGQEEKLTSDSDFQEEVATQQLQQDLKRGIVSEVFKQEKALECFNSREVSAGLEGEFSLQLELASQQLQHKSELEIVSEVFSQKYKEAYDMVLDSKLSESGSVETNEKKVRNNFEELEAHLESFMELEACRRELEACRLERITTGCSTSIAKCEFKLDKLMKNLADQVNKMNAKISFMQDAIKLQEWKHMFEEDILVLVLSDALVEMHKNLNLERTSQRIQGEHGLSAECPISPLNKISATTSSREALALLETEGQRLDSQQMKGRQGVQEKDKLILLLKKAIEELRKEKADSEQKLDDITEELYRLKRQFWKEKEIWVSKLSLPQRKEMEAQVDALARHSSSSAVDLEEEFKKIEEARLDALVSGLKEEWLSEKEGLLAIISQKEESLKSLGPEIARLSESERNSKATEAGLLARIADLMLQADNLSSDKLNQEFHFAKCKQDWKSEKESMRKEINDLLENTSVHAASEASMSARIAELESQLHCLSARIAELNTERESSQQARLDHEAVNVKLKRELEEERECHLRLASEEEDLTSKVVAFSEREKHNAKLIEELEIERAQLIKELLDRKSSSSSLTEEKEIAFALAIKEKTEEEQKRKMLESQLQELRLEVKNLQGLNDKIAELEGKLEAAPRQLESNLAWQVDLSMKASHCFEQKVMQMMQENSIRLDGVKKKCQFLKGPLTKSSLTEAQHRQKLSKELQNLQKAEAEVDLLADEVDSLVDILEEVQVAFDLYAPILVHYPKMHAVAKIVKQEIQLRIDPKYGA